MVENTKVCRRCGQELKKSEFPPNPRLRDGLSSWCRPCHRLAVRASNAKYREEYEARRRAKYRERVGPPKEKRRWIEKRSGYAFVTVKGKGVLEHRVVMEKMLGRKLRRGEQVHHINGVRHDNRPENLQLRVGAHGSGVHARCAQCGSNDLIFVGIGDRQATLL